MNIIKNVFTVFVLAFVSFSALANTPIDASQVPFQVGVGKERQPNGLVYRMVGVMPKKPGLIIKSVEVIGQDCRASSGNPSKPFHAQNGGTYLWKFLIVGPASEKAHPCFISRVWVDTNMGKFNFDPTPYYE